MNTATLEQPNTNTSTAPRLANPALLTATPAVGQEIRSGRGYLQAPFNGVAVEVKQRSGLLSRSVRALKSATFQLGFAAPGKVWYHESTRLNAKEKAELDAQLLGFFD